MSKIVQMQATTFKVRLILEAGDHVIGNTELIATENYDDANDKWDRLFAYAASEPEDLCFAHANSIREAARKEK